MEEVPGSEKFFPAQLVLLALGFLGPEAEFLKGLGIKQDGRSNIQTPPKVGLRLLASRKPNLNLLFAQEILDKYRRRVRCRRLSTWAIPDRLGYKVSHMHPSLTSQLILSFSEGRGAAAEVDAWLSDGSTRLPSAGGIKTRVRISILRSACNSYCIPTAFRAAAKPHSERHTSHSSRSMSVAVPVDDFE